MSPTTDRTRWPPDDHRDRRHGLNLALSQPWPAGGPHGDMASPAPLRGKAIPPAVLGDPNPSLSEGYNISLESSRRDPQVPG